MLVLWRPYLESNLEDQRRSTKATKLGQPTDPQVLFPPLERGSSASHHLSPGLGALDSVRIVIETLKENERERKGINWKSLYTQIIGRVTLAWNLNLNHLCPRKKVFQTLVLDATYMVGMYLWATGPVPDFLSMYLLHSRKGLRSWRNKVAFSVRQLAHYKNPTFLNGLYLLSPSAHWANLPGKRHTCKDKSGEASGELLPTTTSKLPSLA